MLDCSTTSPLTSSPADLCNDTLEAAITTLAANISAAQWQWLSFLEEFDRREAWAGFGVLSCAHWLNWKCGIAFGAAREKLRVARAIKTLPLISAAFSTGELSYSKVRAMTRVATPENEPHLLMIAQYGTASHVEKAVRAYRNTQRVEAAEQAKTALLERNCSWYYDDCGMFVINARLPGEVGALIIEALGKANEDLFADDNISAIEKHLGDGHSYTGDDRDGTPASAKAENTRNVPAETCCEPHHRFGAKRADALCHLAEQFLARGSSAYKAADHHQVVIHVDANALKAVGDYTRCDVDHGPAISPATAQRIACDASIVVIGEGENGEPLTIGRKSRTIPPAIRRFLRHRDQGCRFPGCTQHRFVDAHHIIHWANGGETSAENLVLLCRRHHRMLHEDGFTIHQQIGDTAEVSMTFHTPDGELIPNVPEPVAASDTVDNIAASRGINVSAETCVTRWAGETIDLDLAVLWLLQADGRLHYVRPDEVGKFA